MIGRTEGEASTHPMTTGTDRGTEFTPRDGLGRPLVWLVFIALPAMIIYGIGRLSGFWSIGRRP